LRLAPFALGSFCFFALEAFAFANPTAQDKAQAETFFRAGRALIANGQIAEACEKFAESQRLDPAPGTLLNLGLCHEREGKTASAWAELTEVAEQPGDDPNRGAFARTRAAEIEKRLSYVRVTVEAPAATQTLFLDGKELGRTGWGTGLPVDPGNHVIEAKAAGFTPWKTTVQVAAGTKTLSIAVPRLNAEQVAPPIHESPKSSPVVVPPKESPRATPVAAWVTLGAGVVGLGIGTVFGIQTLSSKSDADALCPTNRCASDARVRELDSSARSSATISTVAFVLGAAGVGIGTVWLLLERAPKSSTSVAWALTPTPQSLSVTGAF
jgi:hypothetical protein